MGIRAEKLSFAYGKHCVLDDLSFEAENGQLLAVIGPNGVGKTTLFRCILGLQQHYQGKIYIDGKDASLLSAKALADKIAYIPQIHNPVFSFSVLDMVLMGTAHTFSRLSMPGVAEKTRAHDALSRLDIDSLADKVFLHLSGGEQQLVLVARALAQGSRNLVMDEPTSALDYGNQNRVMNEIRTLAREGYCVVISTHNPQHAIWYADKVLALSAGSAAGCGAPSAVMTKDLIKELYHMDVSFVSTQNGPMISPIFGQTDRNR